MAYAFDKTMKALQGGKNDIFNPQGMALTDGNGQPQMAGSNAEGDLSGGGSGGSAGETVKQGNETASNAAVSANVGRVQSPANLKSLKESVSATGQRLQDEANKYVTNSAGPKALSASDKENLKYAIDPMYGTTDESGFGPQPGPAVGGPQILDPRTMDFWASQRPENVKAVDPFKTDIDTTNSTIESLGTNAGVQGLLRRSGGAEYNAGEAAFDQALLSKDLGFQKDREALLNDYGALQKTYGEIGDKTTKAGQDAANSAYSQYLGDLRSTLQGMDIDYETQAKAHEAEVEAQAAKDLEALRGTGGQQITDLSKQLAFDPAYADLAQYINPDGIDSGSYFTPSFDPNQYGWEDYLSNDRASTFNNIMSLLGDSRTYKGGSQADGLSGSELGSFDLGKAQGDILTRAQTAAADAQAKADTQNAAEAQAQKETAERAEAIAAARAAEAQQVSDNVTGAMPSPKSFPSGAVRTMSDKSDETLADSNAGWNPVAESGIRKLANEKRKLKKRTIDKWLGSL